MDGTAHSKLSSHFELKYPRNQIMDLFCFLTFSVIKRALPYSFLCNRTCTTSLKLYEDKVLHLENWQKNGENKEKRLMFMGRLVWASGHPAALSCPHVPWTPSSRGRPMKIQNDKISTFRLRADEMNFEIFMVYCWKITYTICLLLGNYEPSKKSISLWRRPNISNLDIKN